MNEIQKILYNRIVLNHEKKQDIAVEFGISRPVLNNLITNGSIYSIDVTRRIAEKSGISPDVLCGVVKRCNDD